MKNIYKEIERKYLQAKKSKDFNSNEFNSKIEQTIKEFYSENKDFDVLKVLYDGKHYVYVQGVRVDIDENKKMYLTTQNNYAYVYRMGGGNEIAHNGCLTCQDIENNLKIKEKDKNISKEFEK